MYTLNVNEYDNTVYERELKNFLPKEFIDCHTHIWKNSFIPEGEANGGSLWIDLVAHELSAEDLMETLKVLFPEHRVTPLVFGGIKHNLTQCNDYVYASAKKYGFPKLFRSQYSMTPDELEEQVKKGEDVRVIDLSEENFMRMEFTDTVSGIDVDLLNQMSEQKKYEELLSLYR